MKLFSSYRSACSAIIVNIGQGCFDKVGIAGVGRMGTSFEG